MQSQSPRFNERSHHDSVPFGAYSLDHGRKKTLESSSRDSRQFYASSFESTVPRFRPWSCPVTDVMYNAERLMDSRPSSLSRSIEQSSVKYAIHRSKYKRFTDHKLNGPDVTYDIDRGNKASLYTSMVQSPITYRNMGAATAASKFGSTRAEAGTAHLGPGSYNTTYPKDVAISPTLHEHKLSSMMSATPRFKGQKVSGIGLGSTYKPESDVRTWHTRAQTISRAEQPRPSYLPRAYRAPGQGKDEPSANTIGRR